MSETVSNPTYSSTDLENAKTVYTLSQRIRKIILDWKAVPFEVEGVIQLMKMMQAIPVPQLKIICLALGLLIALLMVSMYVYKSI